MASGDRAARMEMKRSQSIFPMQNNYVIEQGLFTGMGKVQALINNKKYMSVRKDSLNSSHAHRVCCKHPQRTATHQLTGKGVSCDPFYCEKCSIMLASQGFNVMKLNSIPVPSMNKKGSMSSRNSRASTQRHIPPPNRKPQISAFTSTLAHLESTLTQKLSQLNSYLLQSETEYGRIIEQTNSYFKQLQDILEIQKYTVYNAILGKRAAEEGHARGLRERVGEALDGVLAIAGDIKENMDAVQTVEEGIYNAIMGGYMVKLDTITSLTNSTPSLKPLQPYSLQFPEIPKYLQTLSSKIQLLPYSHRSNPPSNQPSNHNSTHTSFNASYKPHCIRTEEDQVVCISERSSSQGLAGEGEGAEEREEYQYEEQSSIFQPQSQPTISPKQSLKQNQPNLNLQPTTTQSPYTKPQPRPTHRQLAFSFDEHSHGGRQLIIREDSNLMDEGSRVRIRGFEGFGDGKLSKIEERMGCREVCESRESLGEYLDMERSREGGSLQDTETLLIV